MAALCVAIFHSFVWMPVGGQPISVRTISDVHGVQAVVGRIVIAFVQGSSWVAVFFVLSGFVLAKSLKGSPPLSADVWLRFVVRRTFRIMPTLFASLLVVVALLWIRSFLHLFPQGYEWHEEWRKGQPTWSIFWENAGLASFRVNAPSWSLRVEMIAALAFPFLLLICRRSSLIANAVIWLAISLAWSYLNLRLLGPMLLFVIGINSYLYGATLLAKLPDQALPLVGLCSLAMIFVPNLWFFDFSMLQRLASGFGGAGLIVLLSSRRACYGTAWLDSAPARFIGRVSFSFYLLHYVTLYAVTLCLTHSIDPALTQRFPLLVLVASAAFSVPLSLVLAWGMFECIERPSNQVGRWLTRRRV